MRQLALTSVLVAGVLLAWGGPAVAGCPDADGADDQGCQLMPPAATVPSSDEIAYFMDSDLPYVEEITAPADGVALTFADPD